MARSDRPHGGFDPSRLEEPSRPAAVVPKIVEAPFATAAKGFTEVKIVGVGGGGGNAVNRMVEAGVPGRRVHRRQHGRPGARQFERAPQDPPGWPAGPWPGAGGKPEEG